MAKWTVRIDPSNTDAISTLRGHSKVAVCEADGFVWVRGESDSPSAHAGGHEFADAIVRALPGDHFSVMNDGQLLPAGKTVPLGYIPDASWLPITEWVTAKLPVSQWASVKPKTIALKLERITRNTSFPRVAGVGLSAFSEGNPGPSATTNAPSSEPIVIGEAATDREAADEKTIDDRNNSDAESGASLRSSPGHPVNESPSLDQPTQLGNLAILTTSQTWLAYANSAAQVRLKPLQFAASSDGRILVKGNPLPAIRGTRYVIASEVAIPAGMRWVPAVPSSIARKVFGAQPGIILWESNERWELIPNGSFVNASRAAVRETVGTIDGAEGSDGATG